jgi:hypothetical protein
MLIFGQVGSSWGHSAFFGSTWEEKVITPNFFFFLIFEKIKTSPKTSPKPKLKNGF